MNYLEKINLSDNADITKVNDNFENIDEWMTGKDEAINENNIASSIPKRTSNKYIKASTPAGQNDECVVNKGSLNTETKVSVPTTGWSGPTNGLYTRTLNVTNMYAAYKGCRACDYERLTSDTLTTLENKADAFNTIKNIVSNNGSITIYAESVPTTPITLIFYGV